MVMLRNYLKLAMRNMANTPAFTLIHLAGLTIGVAVFLLIFQYILFERSFDRFHENADRIYRVPIQYSERVVSFRKTAGNHPGLGPAMLRDFPQVESFVRLVHPSNFGGNLTLTSEAKSGNILNYNEDKGYLADSTLLDIFSFPVYQGDPATALDDPSNIVITKSIAEKYFGTYQAVGKELKTNLSGPMTVSAVLEDIPANSHLDFNILIPFHSFFGKLRDEVSWVWPEFHTYVLLKPNADPATIEAQFPVFTDRYMSKIHEDRNFMTYFSLQPLLNIHLHSDYANEITPPGSQRMIYFLTLLATLILLIAYFNYINLSTAKSLERATEVGIRKTIGARRIQLVSQFLTEAFLLNALSILLGFFLARSLLPYFTQLVGKDIGESILNLDLFLSPVFWLISSGSVIVGAMLSGLYPAFILSSFRPIQVLRGKFFLPGKRFSMRKLLVGFQFTTSLLLIAVTILVSRQIDFMNKQDLGYTKDQILVVKAPVARDSITYQKTLLLPNELQKLPFITSFTKSSEVPGRLIPLRSETRQWGAGNDLNVINYLYRVDDHFLETYEIPLVAGRNFREIDSSMIYGASNNKVVINEELASTLGYSKPESAIGEHLEFKLGEPFHKAEIIGVTKNIHQRSLKEAYDPLLFYFPSWSNWRFYSIRMQTDDWAGSLSAIERSYRSVFPEFAFEYFFLDEFFDEQYQAERKFSMVCKAMTALTIFITCLGFLGLSSLMLARRTKEIGIRKILGAKTSDIFRLISRDFLVILGISSIITLPLIVLLGRRWLNNFAFNIGLEWQIFILPVLVLVLILTLIISLQLHRSTALNPVHSLRDE